MMQSCRFCQIQHGKPVNQGCENMQFAQYVKSVPEEVSFHSVIWFTHQWLACCQSGVLRCTGGTSGASHCNEDKMDLTQHVTHVSAGLHDSHSAKLTVSCTWQSHHSIDKDSSLWSSQFCRSCTISKEFSNDLFTRSFADTNLVQAPVSAWPLLQSLHDSIAWLWLFSVADSSSEWRPKFRTELNW